MQAGFRYLISDRTKISEESVFFLICETHFISQPLILAKLKLVSTIQALETKFEDPFNSLGQ